MQKSEHYFSNEKALHFRSVAIELLKPAEVRIILAVTALLIVGLVASGNGMEYGRILSGIFNF